MKYGISAPRSSRRTTTSSRSQPAITKVRRNPPRFGKPDLPLTPDENSTHELKRKQTANKENGPTRRTRTGKKAQNLPMEKQKLEEEFISDDEEIVALDAVDDLEFQKALITFRRDTLGSQLSSIYDFDFPTLLAATEEKRNVKLDLERYYGQSCFVCGVGEGELESCCREKCFSRYHAECIDQELLSDFHAFIRPKRVECRRHHCATCFAENYRSTAFRAMPEDRVFRCVYCTNTYHAKCVPAGCPQKDFKIICPQHHRRDTFLYPHLPFCFGCRGWFDENDQNQTECGRCLRSFHKACSQVNMRARSAENVCFQCLSNWSPRRGQLCHVFHEERFYPAQVAQTNWPQAVNSGGLVPVFLLGFGVRNKDSLLQVPNSFVVPMIPFEPMELYYRQHPKCTQFISAYLAKMSEFEANPFQFLPFRPTAQNPKFRAVAENVMTIQMKRQMAETYEEFEAEKCGCVAETDEFKCFSDNCLNRKLTMECSPDCGSGCMNGAEGRNVTDAVEIFTVPFGGFGLRATRIIPEGHPIGEYTGTIIDKERTKVLLGQYEARRNQEEPLYIMCIDNSFNINSAASGNATRFANHSCNPNTRIMRVLGTDSLPHQILYAKRQIEAGEPITFDYNHTWTKYNSRCFCGGESCSGHLSSRLKKKPTQETKRTDDDEQTKQKKTVSRKIKRRAEDPTYNCNRNALGPLSDF